MGKDRPQDVERRIQRIVQELSGSEGAPPSADDDLFASGILDSISLIPLIDELEKSFGVSISSREYAPENFKTIRGLKRMVERLSRP